MKSWARAVQTGQTQRCPSPSPESASCGAWPTGAREDTVAGQSSAAQAQVTAKAEARDEVADLARVVG